MQARYSYIPQRCEFVGVIFDGDTVLTIGAEQTKAEIIKWCQEALEIEPWIKDNPAVKDMYDRAIKH